MPGDAQPERRNREEEVLDAAIELFRRKGYGGTSIQDIADAVGILKGSLYHYFSSKEDLLFRICDESQREAVGIVDRVEAEGGKPLARLDSFVRRYVAYHLENADRVQIYQRARWYLEGERWQKILDQRRIYERYVEDLIEEANPTRNGRYVACFIFGAINGIPDWYRHDGGASPAEIAGRYAAMACAAPAKTTRGGRQ
jgi:TetR/AcrR family transcriptional regulator, cholesterol catabolism regulator